MPVKVWGAHVFCFTSEPIPAVAMITKLNEIAAFIGHGNCEVFPKQAAVLWDEGELGSWLNCCYFDGLLGMRYAVREDGEAMEPEEFLDRAEELKQGMDFFRKPLVTSADMPQGPPCLQHLIQIGFPQG